MRTVIVAVAIAALANAGPALAQFGNPAGMAPDTPQLYVANPATDHANAQDTLFLRQAALAGIAEVQAGEIAQQKGSTPSVTGFGKRMVAEHGETNKALARFERLNPEVPDRVDQQHEAQLNELGQKTGRPFDLAYLTAQIADHQKMANLLMWELSAGQNEGLREYATDALPDVLDHLETARTAFAQVAGGLPPDTVERSN